LVQSPGHTSVAQPQTRHARLPAVASFGLIDRSTFVGCSRLAAIVYTFHHRPVNGYVPIDEGMVLHHVVQVGRGHGEQILMKELPAECGHGLSDRRFEKPQIPEAVGPSEPGKLPLGSPGRPRDRGTRGSLRQPLERLRVILEGSFCRCTEPGFMLGLIALNRPDQESLAIPGHLHAQQSLLVDVQES
jgi:hypothetical protein